MFCLIASDDQDQATSRVSGGKCPKGVNCVAQPTLSACLDLKVVGPHPGVIFLGKNALHHGKAVFGAGDGRLVGGYSADNPVDLGKAELGQRLAGNGQVHPVRRIEPATEHSDGVFKGGFWGARGVQSLEPVSRGQHPVQGRLRAVFFRFPVVAPFDQGRHGHKDALRTPPAL